MSFVLIYDITFPLLKSLQNDYSSSCWMVGSLTELDFFAGVMSNFSLIM